MQPYINVTIVESPVSSRYCQSGDNAQLDLDNKKVRVGGAWFDYDPIRWKVVTTHEKKLK